MSYNIITPQDFGALGNYTPSLDGFDDTSAFMQADAAACATNSILTIPPAMLGCGYKITQSFKPTAPIKIRGAGPNATTIFGHNFAPGVPIIDFDFLPSQTMEHTELSGLTLRSNNGNPIGIRAKDVSYLHLEDLVFDELSNGVVYTGTRCFSNSASRVHGRRVTGSTVKWNSFRGGGQFTFNHCTFSGSVAMYQDNDSVIDRITAEGCNWEGATTFSARFAGTLDGFKADPRTEGCMGPYDFVFCPEVDPRGGGAIHHQSAIVIQGGMFTSNSASTRAMIFGGAAGKVCGVTILGNTARNSSADVFAYMYGTVVPVEDVVIMGNNLAQPNSQIVNPSNVPGLFARANRNGSGQLANVG